MAKNQISRRNFVFKSATGIGGLAVGRYAAGATEVEQRMEKITNPGQNNPDQKRMVVQKDDVVIENDEFRLVIGANGITKSLVSKSTGEECLFYNHQIPVSTITQERPYNNEVKLAYPCQQMTFHANSVKREGNRLLIGYDLLEYLTVVQLNVQSDYVEFKLEDFVIPAEFGGLGVLMKDPAVWQISFLQLPLRKRTYYGDWLQVVWDERVATNISATNPFTNISATDEKEYYLLQAGAERGVKLKGASAALISSATGKLLDHIARVEEDFQLPPGVKSRRSEAYKYSYYWTHDLNPANADRHLKYAKMGGFRAMHLYYTGFLKSRGYRLIGNYDEWNETHYPKGKEDLRNLLKKLEREGMLPGFHYLHSHIGMDSKYITPVPDRRLNLVQTFTLAAPLSVSDTTIHIDQDPSYIEMTDRRRVLRLGKELISYEGFTNERPYTLTGCKRGIWNTKAAAHPVGLLFGVLDVSEFGATSVYINQNNDLQDEVAEKLADIYEAGFKFCYYDGSEGVNPPFWFNIAYAQWKVHRRLNPQPLFAEGAAKTHFSWHMLSRGNAFDVFQPEVLKQEIRKHPASEAPRMKQNFSHLNFGWLGYWVPNDKTVGTQPDMLEFVCSRAAAWDCPIGMMANLDNFDAHPRTADNFEVMRRWEEVRINDWLTSEQKQSLQNVDQEHILLINEKNAFELQPYDQITDIADNSREVRAFIFERAGSVYVVYWHISGDKKLELSLDAKKVTLMKDFQKKSKVGFSKGAGTITVPVNNRLFMKITGVDRTTVMGAFKNARIV